MIRVKNVRQGLWSRQVPSWFSIRDIAFLAMEEEAEEPNVHCLGNQERRGSKQATRGFVHEQRGDRKERHKHHAVRAHKYTQPGWPRTQTADNEKKNIHNVRERELQVFPPRLQEKKVNFVQNLFYFMFSRKPSTAASWKGQYVWYGLKDSSHILWAEKSLHFNWQ